MLTFTNLQTVSNLGLCPVILDYYTMLESMPEGNIYTISSIIFPSVSDVKRDDKVASF